jgi:hypothetical protein
MPTFFSRTAFLALQSADINYWLLIPLATPVGSRNSHVSELSFCYRTVLKAIRGSLFGSKICTSFNL